MFLDCSFNSVLVNCYRDGNDYVGWHADDEPELGDRPLIASISFGATRPFEFRHKKTAAHERIVLGQGDLLIMQPDFQRDWLHRVPVDEKHKAKPYQYDFSESRLVKGKHFKPFGLSL